jgi:uncharacterized protein YhaN
MTKKDPVTVEEVDIVRAPGFETEGFELDEFSSGINIIYGPNGAGKTTTAESIMKVLWPDAATDNERLVGQVSLNGEQWRIDVQNGTADYQRNGQETTPPTLPSADQRDRYHLSLHDLLQQDIRNESFAETIERESAGGYDLSAAHEALEYDDSPISRRMGVYQAAEDAIETWRGERDEARDLEEERSRLAKLENELKEAKQAREKAEALEQAIEYQEAKTEYERASERLDDFPDKLEDVSGDELQRVDELTEEIEEWTREKQDASEDQQAAQQEIANAALSENESLDGVLKRLKQRRDRLADCESRENEVEEELARAKKTREQTHEEIPLDIEQSDLQELDPSSLAEISNFARLVDEVRATRKQQERLTDWGEIDTEPEANQDALEDGSKALEEWLMAEPARKAETSGQAAFRIGAISGGIVSLAGVALGSLVNPLLFGVVPVGLALFAYGYQQRETGDSSESPRTTHRNSFERTELEPPVSWSEEDVRKRLTELYNALAEHQVLEERRQQRETALAEQDLESKEKQLAQKREELQDRIGATPATTDTDIELAVIVRRVHDWQQAHDEVEGLQAELEEIQDNLESEREKLQDELTEYDYDSPRDSATATEQIRDLEQRWTNHQEAKRKLSTAEDALEKADTKIQKLETNHDEVFTNLELDPGNRERLKTLCEQIEDYEDAKREVDKTSGVVERERQKLQTLPGYEPEFEERELSDLRQAFNETEAIAERYDRLNEQITEIKTKIETAKKESKVEDAITEKNRALNSLDEHLESDYAAMVGDVLVEHLQEETIEANRPAVFQRADSLLVTITHGRYELLLEEGEQTFRAYDRANQQGFALEELSTGTRLQVLLAVRLAFVEQQEHDTQLPIILDETLANTDDLRAEVIIDSMIELARDGRQIFYFTAQGDEVAKWQAAVEARDDVEYNLIDLSEAREIERKIQLPDLDEIGDITPSPPSPEEHDHASYGEELEVGQFNPYTGAGTAHLWYVVEDIAALHDLLELGIERWGQLNNLIERGRNEFIPADAETIEHIQQAGAALEEFVDAWRVGRGDPVDRAALEATDAVSDNFIDRVTELAEEVGGDAERLINAIHDGKIDRFRSGKADDLEEYLRANGYLVSRESLSDDEIRIRMIQGLVDHGVSRGEAAERADDILARISGNQLT